MRGTVQIIWIIHLLFSLIEILGDAEPDPDPLRTINVNIGTGVMGGGRSEDDYGMLDDDMDLVGRQAEADYMNALGKSGGQDYTSALGRSGGQDYTSALGRSGGQDYTSALGRSSGQDYHEFGINNVRNMEVQSGSGASAESEESEETERPAVAVPIEPVLGSSEEARSSRRGRRAQRGRSGGEDYKSALGRSGGQDYHEFGINNVRDMLVEGGSEPAAEADGPVAIPVNPVTLARQARLGRLAQLARQGADYHEFGINNVRTMTVEGDGPAAADSGEAGVDAVVDSDARLAALARAGEPAVDAIIDNARLASLAGYDYHEFGINNVRTMTVQGDGPAAASGEAGVDAVVDSDARLAALARAGDPAVDAIIDNARLAALAGYDYHEFGINNVRTMTVQGDGPAAASGEVDAVVDSDARLAALARAGYDYHEFGINNVRTMTVEGDGPAAARDDSYDPEAIIDEDARLAGYDYYASDPAIDALIDARLAALARSAGRVG